MTDARQQRESEVIIQRACDVYHVSREALLGRARDLDSAWARQVVCYALRRLKWPLADIGAVMQRDHSTVCHAIQRVERRIRASGVDREAVGIVTGEISMVSLETAAVVADIEDAIGRLHEAMRAGMRLLEAYEARARTLRADVATPIQTRGAA